MADSRIHRSTTPSETRGEISRSLIMLRTASLSARVTKASSWIPSVLATATRAVNRALPIPRRCMTSSTATATSAVVPSSWTIQRPTPRNLILDGGAPGHVTSLVDVGQVVEFLLPEIAHPLAETCETAFQREFLDALLEQLLVRLDDRTQRENHPVFEGHLVLGPVRRDTSG